jgi:uncharacterized protein
LVLDTNVLVSGLIWSGAPRRLLDQGFQEGTRFYTSVTLLDELYRVLSYPRLTTEIVRKQQTPQGLYELAASVLRVVQTQALATSICRDPDDDEVLACSVAAHADLIISGDADLLTLQNYQGVPIMKANQALEWLAA